MANIGMESAPVSKSYPVGWLVNSCDWIWKHVIRVFWIGILAVLALGILVNWATDFHKVPDILVWMYNHLLLVIIITISLVSLTILIGIIRLLPVGASERAMKRKYLACLADSSVVLGLAGITTGFVTKAIALEKVFIRPLFHFAPPTDIHVPDEEELEPMRRFREQGIRVQEYTRLLNEARREREARSGETIDIAELWQRLTRENPAIVIQGYPGIGKSTFLNRLTLCMARRATGKSDDDSVLSTLTPTMIPLFVSIKEYADWREKRVQDSDEQRSVLSFLQESIAKSFDPHDYAITPFVKKWLDDCICLVLFDGLDEVSDQAERVQIQKAIKAFIQKHHHPDNQRSSYNRFLITTRIAGYDIDAFPYPNYLIAELEEDQIAEFLPRWCRASINVEEVRLSPEGLNREVDRVTKSFLKAMRENPGVQRLAKIPLLLTLMAAMKQKGIDLPRNRAELYKSVTETLLEKRNIAKGTPSLSVAQAVQRIGPLAYEMNKEDNQFATKQIVLTSVEAAIRSPQGGGANLSEEQVQRDAKEYLRRISERGGLFVKRLSDYYGFFHRTFGEYFAARYILNRIELATDQEQEMRDFITLVRQSDDLWREPYLFAVAHKSEEFSAIANALISQLFHSPATATMDEKLHDLLLATTAVVESKENTIDLDLQEELASTLLQHYRKVFRLKRFDDCDKVENAVQQWLLSLTELTYQPKLLTVIEKALLDVVHPEDQRPVLTLLAIIAQQLVTSIYKDIFSTLIPPLLALAGLPAVVPGEAAFTPTPGLAASNDLTVRDLALTVLSLLGKCGPGGRLLEEKRQEIESCLPQLARYSLECGTLITPTSIPLSDEKYVPYESAIGRYIDLRERVAKSTRITNSDVAACLDIHKTLLESAEDISYPAAITILAMLHASATSTGSWQETWQTYLLNQLENGSPILYFDSALLYNSLFAEREAQESLATLVEQHYNKPSLRQQLASRFIAYISEDFRAFRAFRAFRFFQAFRDLRNFRTLQTLQTFRALRYLRYLRSLQDTQLFRAFRDLRDLRDFQAFRDLRFFLLTYDVAQKAMHRLKQPEPMPDLLLILQGRVLQIQEVKSVGTEFEEEVQQIVRVITPFLTSTILDEVHDAALDILRHLPARTENEIRFVITGAEQAQNKWVRDAYCKALQYARPLGESEKHVLREMGEQSQVAEVRKAVEWVLRWDML